MSLLFEAWTDVATSSIGRRQIDGIGAFAPDPLSHVSDDDDSGDAAACTKE